MTVARLSWSFARSAAAGMIVALVLAVAVPVAFGGRSFSVLSGSMEPAISTGDLVMTEAIAPGEAAGGDVVTFTDPEDKSRLITHRVATVAQRADTYAFVTKGDANETVERWSVPANGRIGRVVYTLPKLGYALTAMKGRVLILLLITVPVLLLAGYALMSIWRPREKEAPDASTAA